MPFVDVGHPTIAQIMFRRGKNDVAPGNVKGRVQICCVAYDTTPISVPAALAPHAGRAGAAALPHLLRRASASCRCARGATCASSASPTRSTSSTGRTRGRTTRTSPGTTRFILAHDWNSATFANDNYLLEVEAADIHGNRAVSSLPFTIRNGT